ncbi:MAG: hypothetical protein RLZZ305_1744 [Actinomycetota bacterium]
MSHDHPDEQLRGRAHESAGLAHEVAARLATVNQRLTPTRRAIVEALAAADRPLSIPEILASGQGLAQSSVYRNLSVLERAGAVARVVTTDEWARFELAEVLTGHHHHLVCSKCGAVSDVRVPDDVEADLDRALGVLAVREGFELLHHRLDLVGVCSACR